MQKLGDAFAGVLFDQLQAQGLTGDDSGVTALPRRAAWPRMCAMSGQGRRQGRAPKLMPVAVGLTPRASHARAAEKLQALGADVSPTRRRRGRLQQTRPMARPKPCSMTAWSAAPRWTPACKKRWTKPLPAAHPKVMSYQLETDCELPGWSSVNFVRPAHGLVALHGSTVVPVKALGLTAGRTTQGHRFEAAKPVVRRPTPTSTPTLARDGAVIASFAERKAEIARQLAAAARGGQWRAPHRGRRPARRGDGTGRAPQRAGLRVRENSSWTCRRSASSSR